MKIVALPALVAALALGACSEANAPEPTETETVVEETVVPMPAPETTTVVTEGDATPADDGDSVTINEDGVDANVGDQDTRVRADIDRDPSLTVEND